jgi:hypothetical protein
VRVGRHLLQRHGLPKAGQSCYTNQYATATNVAANGGPMECCNTKGGSASTGAYAISCTCNTCSCGYGCGCVPSGGPGQTCNTCNVDADCPIGNKCMKPTTGGGSCVAACAPVGHAPTTTLSCCDGLVVDAANVCLLPAGAPCLADSDCKSHVCNRTTTDATCG